MQITSQVEIKNKPKHQEKNYSINANTPSSKEFYAEWQKLYKELNRTKNDSLF